MTLREYLKTINKDCCPQNCKFIKYKEDIPIARIPPPSNEILGILISRDPTVKWMEEYKDKKRNVKKNLLFV